MPLPFFAGIARFALLAIFLVCFFAMWWALWQLGDRQREIRSRYRYWWIDPRATIASMFIRETLIFVIIWVIGAASLLGFNALGK
jgi:hypothetical protein